MDKQPVCPLCHGSGYTFYSNPLSLDGLKAGVCPACRGVRQTTPARPSDFTPGAEVFESDMDPRTSE